MNARPQPLGLNWQISMNSGWGVFGFNLAVQAERDGRWLVVPLVPPIHRESVPQEQQQVMQRVFARSGTLRNAEEPLDFPVLHSLGNWFGTLPDDPAERVRGTIDLAIIFLEDTSAASRIAASARRFARVLAGSTWNEQVLLRAGLQNVTAFLQGVDSSLFSPLPRKQSVGRPFVIFSGGKLEFRKGQDIVVAAFREFHKRHPDSVLLTAWQNAWHRTIEGISSRGYVQGTPAVTSRGDLDIVGWLEQNGIPRRAAFDIGPVPNHLMPEAYKQADCAVLPNRCEGGTNLVAMECLACGLPTILSANTGHLDLVDERHCYPLTRQNPVAPLPPFGGTEGWGESDVAEVVEKLEQIYCDRHDAQKRAAAAATFMRDWSWEKRFGELVRHLEECGAGSQCSPRLGAR